MIGDAAQNVGEPCLWVDAVEFCCGDQSVHRGSALAATVGAGEQPCAAPESDPAQNPFGGIVAEADAAIVEKAGEGWPALEHVIHGLGTVGVTRQLPTDTRPTPQPPPRSLTFKTFAPSSLSTLQRLAVTGRDRICGRARGSNVCQAIFTDEPQHGEQEARARAGAFFDKARRLRLPVGAGA